MIWWRELKWLVKWIDKKKEIGEAGVKLSIDRKFKLMTFFQIRL